MGLKQQLAPGAPLPSTTLPSSSQNDPQVESHVESHVNPPVPTAEASQSAAGQAMDVEPNAPPQGVRGDSTAQDALPVFPPAGSGSPDADPGNTSSRVPQTYFLTTARPFIISWNEVDAAVAQGLEDSALAVPVYDKSHKRRSTRFVDRISRKRVAKVRNKRDHIWYEDWRNTRVQRWLAQKKEAGEEVTEQDYPATPSESAYSTPSSSSSSSSSAPSSREEDPQEILGGDVPRWMHIPDPGGYLLAHPSWAGLLCEEAPIEPPFIVRYFLLVFHLREL